MFKLDKEKNIIIYGAGKKGKILCQLLQQLSINVICIMDRNEALWGKRIEDGGCYGVKICRPLETLSVDKSNIVVICTMENALQHEKAALMLYKGGYKNIIFLPVLHMENKHVKSLFEIYDNLISGNFSLNEKIDLPDYDDIICRDEEHCIYGKIWKNNSKKIILYLPIELLYSEFVPAEDNEYGNAISAFRSANVVSCNDYFELWEYLRTGRGSCTIYFKTHFPNRDLSMDEKKNFLVGRNNLLMLYDKESKKSDNNDFFFQSPAKGVYNSNGYISVQDGLHRITYLITRNEWEVPVELTAEEYSLLGNDEKIITEIIMEKKYYYIEHPVFYLYNRESRENIRKFLFSIQKTFRDFSKKRFLVIGQDGGYLLRNVLRAGSEYVLYCTSEFDIKWCEKLMEFFGFMNKAYEINTLNILSTNSEWDCVIADLSYFDNQKEILRMIMNVKTPQLFLRIADYMLDIIKCESEIIELEKYWIEDTMTITAQITR